MVMADARNMPGARLGLPVDRLRTAVSRMAPIWWSLGQKIMEFCHAPGARMLANQRAEQLFRENLTPDQREQYARQGCFDVIGQKTGNLYRIAQGASMNVSQLDSNGRCIRRLCFQPQGALAQGDSLLAQKIALECFELDALEVANTIVPDGALFRSERQPGSQS
jgi:hypothetical protein